MTRSDWKVVIDGDSLTISSDAFTFTTCGADATQLEAVVADLQSAVRGTYGQYCGLSRAAEMVGERWGFLIVRDLLVGPRSATELHDGLPKTSAKVLSRRLNEMEFSGVVRRTGRADGAGDERYELTEYGRALEEAVMAFGRWGAASLAAPRPDDIVTDASLMIALKATFLPETADDLSVSYELHVAGHVLNARIAGGVLEVGAGPLPGADAVLHLGVALLPLLTGQATVTGALAGGEVRVDGDPAQLSRFVRMFQLPRLAAPARRANEASSMGSSKLLPLQGKGT